jgi:site-specific recombinase XerD
LRQRPDAPAGASLEALIESWGISLEARDLSAKTIRSYTDSAKALCRFLDQRGMPADSEGVQVDHIRLFLIHEKKRTSAASAGTHFSGAGSTMGLLPRWILRRHRRTPAPDSAIAAVSESTRRGTQPALADGRRCDRRRV